MWSMLFRNVFTVLLGLWIVWFFTYCLWSTGLFTISHSNQFLFFALLRLLPPTPAGECVGHGFSTRFSPRSSPLQPPVSALRPRAMLEKSRALNSPPLPSKRIRRLNETLYFIFTFWVRKQGPLQGEIRNLSPVNSQFLGCLILCSWGDKGQHLGGIREAASLDKNDKLHKY